jgi:uncharacterized SAM-binding protein YcdF (DUF218 family)
VLTKVIGVVVLLVAAWLVAALVLFVLPHGDKPVHANAVFVLSGSPARLPVGVKLVREGYAPLLVVSRSSPKRTPLEAAACAHRLGIRVLCVQAEPYSTVGEAETLARLAAQRHWTAVNVVTSKYHILRARMLIRRCYHGTLRMVGAPNGFLTLAYNAVMETVKLAYHELVHRGC